MYELDRRQMNSAQECHQANDLESFPHVEVFTPRLGFCLSNVTSCNCKKRRFSTTFMKGKLGKHLKSMFLIDSGSCNTLINLKTWNDLCVTEDISREIHDSKLKFKSSNGNLFNCIGWAYVRVKIGRYYYMHPSYIIDGSCHDYIIGCDFLDSTGARINYLNSSINIDQQLLPMFSLIYHSEKHHHPRTLPNNKYF